MCNFSSTDTCLYMCECYTLSFPFHFISLFLIRLLYLSISSSQSHLKFFPLFLCLIISLNLFFHSKNFIQILSLKVGFFFCSVLLRCYKKKKKNSVFFLIQSFLNNQVSIFIMIMQLGFVVY